jgi:hypothetical protein
MIIVLILIGLVVGLAMFGVFAELFKTLIWPIAKFLAVVVLLFGLYVASH